MMKKYLKAVDQALQRSQWTIGGGAVKPDVGFLKLAECLSRRQRDGSSKLQSKIMFIGNGGSAAIAEHMATDYTKAGHMRAQAFNSGSLLTCLANDYSFDEVFSRAVGLYADENDILVAISSSGASRDILLGAEAGKERCCVVTLSGFHPDNPLRLLGYYNIYVPSLNYGTVEIAHYMILHALLDHIAGNRM